ncbi:prolyl endopeptidase-like protein [Tanacetum coccineum]
MAGRHGSFSVHPRFSWIGSYYDARKVDAFGLIASLQNGRLGVVVGHSSLCKIRELHDKLIKSYEYPNFGASFREAEKYFYFHNSGLQPQKVMYMQVYMVVELCGEIKDDEAYDRRKRINLLWAVKDAAMCAVSDKEKWRRMR